MHNQCLSRPLLPPQSMLKSNCTAIERFEQVAMLFGMRFLLNTLLFLLKVVVDGPGTEFVLYQATTDDQRLGVRCCPASLKA